MTIKSNEDQSFLQPQSHRFYNFAILVTGLLIFIFVPLFMLTPEQTKEFVNNGRELQVIGDTLFLVAIYCLIVGAIYWLLALFKLRDIGGTIVMFILSWVALSGFLFSLTTANGMLELRFAPTHKLNLYIVVGLSAVLAVLSVSRFAKTVQVFLVIFLTVSILPSLATAFSKFEKQNTDAKEILFSKEKNLLLVGLDGLPGHMVKDVLGAKPELAARFTDFTFYENVASSSPATDAALLGIVYGNHDFTKWDDPAPIDWKNLYFNKDDKVDFTTNFKYNIYNKNGTKLTAGQYGKAEQRDQLIEMYRNVAARLTTKFGVATMDVIERVFFVNREGKFYSSVEGFDKVVKSMSVGAKKPSVIYTHFTFTHWPTVMDENCIDRKMDMNWYKQNQNIEGITAGTICGLNKYAELIDKLKLLGVYDNTTIVFLSDHGKPVAYYDKPPHNLTINNTEALGFDRYQPFLMIKPIGQKSETLSMDAKYVVLDDLAQTTCNVFEAAEICEQTPGLNVLDDTDVAPDNFYIHVAKDETSTWMVFDHKAVKISRHMPLLDAMMASDEIELTER